MKKSLFLLVSILALFSSCKTTSITENHIKEEQKTEFQEIWAYLMQNEEKFFSPDMPLTDIGYFVKAINTYSEQEEFPPKDKFFSNTNARVHIVSSVDSRAQTHLLLDPNLPLRNNVIDQLIKYSKTYDGIQIDWELVPSRDKENYLSFLKELKSRMNGKTLSVAISARIRKLNNDVYDYDDLSKIADKIIIMAYDEHWSTSKPGAVASYEWCEKVVKYASSVIPQDKLIMGLPFYGRTWRDDKDGGSAYKYNSIKKLIDQNSIKVHRDPSGISNFTFKKKLTIEGWFDDAKSLDSKAKMYKSYNVPGIAFWRLGQEDSNWWEYLKIKKDSPKDES